MFTGREVAVYCATHLGEIIKATESYSKGNVSQALRDAFMKCDDIIVKEDAVKEMKKIVEDDMSKIHRYQVIISSICMYIYSCSDTCME